ncbi:MAG: hypothetical protein IKW83_06005 [Muribaculaceae bacterium]|nr:hypothetical protein [Muribaculaceae bacterium]
MDYQLITSISLVVASLIALAVMLRYDMVMLQQQDYSNKKFMKWLQDSDETYSSKRIAPMAALVACASNYARESWMVVALIAIAILALPITMLMSKKNKSTTVTKRAILSIIIALVVAAACATSLINAKFSLEAGMFVLLLTSFSYALTLGANWIVGLFSKKNNNNTQSINQDEEI